MDLPSRRTRAMLLDQLMDLRIGPILDLLDLLHHGEELLVAGVQLGLQLGRVAALAPLEDGDVVLEHLDLMVADVLDRGLDLACVQIEPCSDPFRRPALQPLVTGRSAGRRQVTAPGRGAGVVGRQPLRCPRGRLPAARRHAGSARRRQPGFLG